MKRSILIKPSEIAGTNNHPSLSSHSACLPHRVLVLPLTTPSVSSTSSLITDGLPRFYLEPTSPGNTLPLTASKQHECI